MVNNKEDGITYLSSRLLSIPDRPMDMYNISATLLQIVHLKSMPLAAKEAIRAIAYIIDDHAALEIAEAILPHIVAPATERITNKVIKALAPYMANLLHTSQSITNTSDTLKTNQTALSELSHFLNDHAEHIKSSHTTAQNNTNNGHLATTNEDIKDIKNAIDQIIPAINTSRRAAIAYFDSDLTDIKEAIDKITPTSPIEPSIKEAIESTKPASTKSSNTASSLTTMQSQMKT